MLCDSISIFFTSVNGAGLTVLVWPMSLECVAQYQPELTE